MRVCSPARPSLPAFCFSVISAAPRFLASPFLFPFFHSLPEPCRAARLAPPSYCSSAASIRCRAVGVCARLGGVATGQRTRERVLVLGMHTDDRRRQQKTYAVASLQAKGEKRRERKFDTCGASARLTTSPYTDGLLRPSHIMSPPPAHTHTHTHT